MMTEHEKYQKSTCPAYQWVWYKHVKQHNIFQHFHLSCTPNYLSGRYDEWKCRAPDE